jgi:hypothetical protein
MTERTAERLADIWVMFSFLVTVGWVGLIAYVFWQIARSLR